MQNNGASMPVERVDGLEAAASGARKHVTWWFVALLGALGALGPLSIDTYLPSLPTIVRDLRASAGAGEDTLAVFFAGLAIGQLFYGPASDRLGRRGPILFGVSLYVAASLACALSPDIRTLLVARLCQALGGCAAFVVSRAIVRDHFDHQESARFFSLLALVMGAAPILAPLAGGLILTFAGWRAIFVILAAIGASVGIAVYLLLAESRSDAAAQRAREQHPFRTYLGLLRNRRLLRYLAVTSLNSASMFTYIASSAAVIIGLYHVPPTRFGLVFGANAVGLIAISQLNRYLLRFYAADGLLRGAALASVAFAVLLAVSAVTGWGGLWGILPPLFLTVSLTSMIQANSLAGALSTDPLRAGSIAALVGSASFAVSAIAASIAGAAYDGTARPMAFVILACLGGCAAATFGVARTRHP